MKSTHKFSLIIFALTISAPVFAEELGRLFFTPQQRTQLDRHYIRVERPDNNDQSLTLNGLVQKDGGSRTIWINGVAQQAGVGDDKVPESVPVNVPGKDKSVRLKVGQRVLLNPSANPDTAQQNSSRPPSDRQNSPDDD